MEMVMAGMLMDKEEHNELMSGLINNISGKGILNNNDTRIMVIGAESDDIEIVKLVESLGGSVVIDSHSIGTRYFWNDVLPGDKPVSNIAARYINRIPMPQMDFPEHKQAEISLKLAQDYNVKGVIILINMHCDPFQWDVPIINRAISGESHTDYDPSVRCADTVSSDPKQIRGFYRDVKGRITFFERSKLSGECYETNNKVRD